MLIESMEGISDNYSILCYNKYIMLDIPSVKVLEAFKPENAGKGEELLVYGGLMSAIERYKESHNDRSQRVWDSEVDSLGELSAAQELAKDYLLQTSGKLVDSDEKNRDLWASRFTEASIELYGAPEKKEATSLLREEYNLLNNLKDANGVSQGIVNYLITTYEKIIPTDAEAVEVSNKDAERMAIEKYGQAITGKYQQLFNLVDESESEDFDAAKLKELFITSLEWLKDNDDKEWEEWKIVEVDGTTVSVNASKKEIKLPSRREAASKQDARGLIAHELLVHALRAKNGYKTGVNELATGVAGYLDAEEGLGILAEDAVNGELPEKAYDRYLDIALALGTIDGVQISRKELFKISLARQTVRAQIKGTFEETQLPSMEKRVWTHIDRIYRGGTGDANGVKQAIFTKDIAYYVGYKKMAEYITAKLASGDSVETIFNFLSQGKFDPNNDKHLEKLNNR